MELPLVILVTLTGGTEELLFSWVPQDVGEVTALTAAFTVGHLTVAVLPPAALAEMERDTGKTLLSDTVWNHFPFWFSVASCEQSPTLFALCDAELYDSSLLCKGEDKAAKEPDKLECTPAGAFRCGSFSPLLCSAGFPLRSDRRALCSRFLFLQYSLFWARVASSYSEAGR